MANLAEATLTRPAKARRDGQARLPTRPPAVAALGSTPRQCRKRRRTKFHKVYS